MGAVHITMFMPAYHTYTSFHNDVDTGEIVYGPMTENYKAFLTTMAQWYAEGLIDPEYMTTDYQTAIGNVTSGKSVAGYMMVGGMIGNITHLNVTLDQMRKDVDAQKAAAKESHRRLWEHNEEQDEKLENHECRIKILEIKKQEEQK